MLQPGNVDQVERLTGSCLVELIVVAPQGQDQIQEDMKNFAEQLKPYPWLSAFVVSPKEWPVENTGKVLCL